MIPPPIKSLKSCYRNEYTGATLLRPYIWIQRFIARSSGTLKAHRNAHAATDTERGEAFVRA
jgi:hypothetical protein